MEEPSARTDDTATDGGSPVERKAYRVGTLSYTKAGLFALFGWLLWGDFCFVLMEAAAPAVLQVNLQEMGAANWLIGLVLVTIPGALNMTVCPATSFWSDRFRSRWGRRIPFLFAATIPLSLFLMLIGFSRQLGGWLHTLLQGTGYSQTAVILTLIVVFVFGFQVFNMVISSIYYYLFNDVVPAASLARFMAMFRVVGTISGAAFNWFMLKYAVSHMTEVYLVAAGLYCSAFLIMCWRVKEGEYPPPPPHTDGGTGIISGIKTFFRESYSIRFYWLFFLSVTCSALAFIIPNSFGILLAQGVGVDLDFYGKTLAVAGLVGAVLLYPAGILADRLHPLRILIVATLAQLCVWPLWLVFLFRDFSPSVTNGIFIAISAISVPATALYFAAEFPTYMRILPKDRYGQFCSATAVVRSCGVMLGGLLLGGLLDRLKVAFPAQDYCYRFLPLWATFFFAASLVFLLLLQRAWRRRGGLHSYTPPGLDDAGACGPGICPRRS